MGRTRNKAHSNTAAQQQGVWHGGTVVWWCCTAVVRCVGCFGVVCCAKCPTWPAFERAWCAPILIQYCNRYHIKCLQFWLADRTRPIFLLRAKKRYSSVSDVQQLENLRAEAQRRVRKVSRNGQRHNKSTTSMCGSYCCASRAV